MASKSGSSYREDMLSRSSAASRRVPTDRGGGVSVDAKAPEISQHPTRSAQSSSKPLNFDPSSSRDALIATAAYYRAENRGFLPGFEIEDWLAAEREVDGMGRTHPAG
jgi:hypothetical protein